MPNQAKPCASSGAVKSGMPEAYYQLHGLLQTLRALASHEDEVCSLLAHVGRTGKVSGAVRRELEQLLESMPVLALEQEVRGLWHEVEKAA